MARLAKLSPKNQLTLPKDVVSHYPDVHYFEIRDSGTEITLAPVLIPSGKDEKAWEGLEKIRKRIADAGITERDIEEAAAWARKKKR